jgi:cytochrome c2
MRIRHSFAAASAFALALAACGPAEEPAEDGDAAMPPAAAAPSAAASASPAPSASASAVPSAAASATPSPAATPTQVAAAPAAPVTAPASFAQCGVCHSVQRGQNGIGPSLAGVAGRRAGTLAGFTYTDGMKNLGVSWNDANLDRYLSGPQAMVPGTTMAIGPLNAGDRRAIIAYLKTL